ncbi:hypothetical protein [Blastococcus xanthinilyticus]|uniref:Uncharacterized protein n=1 Tax=Blastococcus xanthinilyticus TaxID=1564164 RepID=A0A5S5CZB9_9ACTN|nr:hypothetical protein [Blastococcus xanthinilyticus]TYP89093.1 hypothetical protein BD833_103250 [Blastococcus xanthinilyticus]
MAAVLLSVHVVAAVVFVGSVTVAVSLFPRYARLALDGTTARSAVPALQLLHRITRVYAVLALAVPVFGLATAAQLGVLGNAWVQVSMALTALAGLLLAAVVLPGQRELLSRAADGSGEPPGSGAAATTRAAALDAPALVRRLGAYSGVVNLLWVVVVVLMIVRPGSTTGV